MPAKVVGTPTPRWIYQLGAPRTHAYCSAPSFLLHLAEFCPKRDRQLAWAQCPDKTDRPLK
eukprot:6961441-Pyramimonas_sp.AAC.1